MSKTILIIATLDTEGKETAYLRDLILRGGHKPLIMNLGSGDEAEGCCVMRGWDEKRVCAELSSGSEDFGISVLGLNTFGFRAPPCGSSSLLNERRN